MWKRKCYFETGSNIESAWSGLIRFAQIKHTCPLADWDICQMKLEKLFVIEKIIISTQIETKRQYLNGWQF